MPQRTLEPRPGFVAVGRVVRSWGLGGDLKVESLTDFPERFEPGETLWLNGRTYAIEESRWQKGMLYLKLSGIDDPETAEENRDALLEVSEADLRPLAEDEFYHYQLTGLRVETEEGEELGVVAEVLPTGGNAVLVVRGPRGEILLPFIEDVIRAVDLSAGLVRVTLIEGLLPEPKQPKPRRLPPWQYRKQQAQR